MNDRRVIEDASGVGTLLGQGVPISAERPLVFLPRRVVEQRVGLSRSTIYQRVAAGTFPKPVHDLETSTVWWLEHEVTAWQRARVAVRDQCRSGEGWRQ